jgi:hypothetical protein
LTTLKFDDSSCSHFPDKLQQLTTFSVSHYNNALNNITPHPHFHLRQSHTYAFPFYHHIQHESHSSRNQWTTLSNVSSDKGFSFACTACRNAEGDRYSPLLFGLVSFSRPSGHNPAISLTISFARGRASGSVSQHCTIKSQISSVSPHCVHARCVAGGFIGRLPSSIALITLIC